MLLITIFLAFALTAHFISCSPIPTSTPAPDYLLCDKQGFVCDIEGNALGYGEYYTMTGGPFCGKVDVWPRDNETCNYDIIQHYFRRIGGTNFIFTPPDGIIPSDNRIKLGSVVAIQSPTWPNLCNDSSVWTVNSDSGIDAPVITIGGVLNTPNSCFRLIRPEKPVVPVYTYIIQHCPYLCGAGVKQCYDVGIFDVGLFKHLASKAPYLELVFDRVDDDNPSLNKLA